MAPQEVYLILGKMIYGLSRARSAVKTPSRIKAPPSTWIVVSDSPSRIQAIMVAKRGSVRPTVDACDARRCLIEARTSEKVTTVPNRIIQIAMIQMGKEILASLRGSELPESASQGKDHHGWVTTQNSEAAANPHIVSEIGSRGFSTRICRSPKI